MIAATLISLAVLIGSLNFLRFLNSLKAKSLSSRITLVETIPNSNLLFFSWFQQTFGSQKSKSFQSALFELPELLDLISVALASGESIFNSMKRVIDRADGVVAREFRQLLRAVDMGETFESQLEELAIRLPQQQVVELCNKLVLALRRGTPIAAMLNAQSNSVRQEVRNQLTKQAGKNETRMMIPLVFLILPVTVLFAVFPSLQLLNLQSI